MSRPPIDPALLEIRPLAAADAEAARGFSCGDEDLDDFLRTDAIRLQEQNVVRSFSAVYEGDLVGYVALLVDAVELKISERKKLALHFHDHPIVPALKIARLGVSQGFRARHRGVGEALMYYAYSSALDLADRVGCRLLTLDAYPASIAFYERLGFVRNQAKAYEGKAHPSMRLDLFAPAVPAWISGWDGSVRPTGGS
jgi:ribosomal protein S18 acetylase RimI-like enzyme